MPALILPASWVTQESHLPSLDVSFLVYEMDRILFCKYLCVR